MVRCFGWFRTRPRDSTLELAQPPDAAVAATDARSAVVEDASTHTIFVELKEPNRSKAAERSLGPTPPDAT